MIPKRRPREKMGLREPSRIECPGHRKWVRGFGCAMSIQGDCSGRIEAAHVRMGTDGGMGVKPSDCYVVPLCAYHHRRQHQIGEEIFWLGRDPVRLALYFWNHHDNTHRLAYERKKERT